jgi:hypothetical protein
MFRPCRDSRGYHDHPDCRPTGIPELIRDSASHRVFQADQTEKLENEVMLTIRKSAGFKSGFGDTSTRRPSSARALMWRDSSAASFRSK